MVARVIGRGIVVVTIGVRCRVHFAQVLRVCSNSRCGGSRGGGGGGGGCCLGNGVTSATAIGMVS